MAKGIYVGVNSLARKVKGGYIGVSNIARKIKKAYVGIGGVARPVLADAKAVYGGNVCTVSTGHSATPTSPSGCGTDEYAMFYGFSRSTSSANNFSSTLVHVNQNLVAGTLSEGTGYAEMAGVSTGGSGLFIGGMRSSSSKTISVSDIQKVSNDLVYSSSSMPTRIYKSAYGAFNGRAILAGGQSRTTSKTTDLATIYSVSEDMTYQTIYTAFPQSGQIGFYDGRSAVANINNNYAVIFSEKSSYIYNSETGNSESPWYLYIFDSNFVAIETGNRVIGNSTYGASWGLMSYTNSAVLVSYGGLTEPKTSNVTNVDMQTGIARIDRNLLTHTEMTNEFFGYRAMNVIHGETGVLRTGAYAKRNNTAIQMNSDLVRSFVDDPYTGELDSAGETSFSKYAFWVQESSKTPAINYFTVE